MSERLVRVYPDTYVDSVRLMAAVRAMEASAQVERAHALMATPPNLAVLGGEGFADATIQTARANDLVVAVEAATAVAAAAALAAGEAALVSVGRSSRTEEPRARSVGDAAARLADANVAIVSVPGPFAALQAHEALTAGLHVLLFSDNVAVQDEVELKERASGLGLLVMGPGAGTAMLGGVGLGFANAVRRGSVGVVAAAGTGAQEVTSLLHRWGAGPAEVIGIGGRDLSGPVGGRMARMALRALERDARVAAVLLVSKPPAPAVARRLVDGLGAKPTVVALLGFVEPLDLPDGVRLAPTLEEATALTLDALGLPRPVRSAGIREEVEGAISQLPGTRTAVRGLFSGGTLCYEAMIVASPHLGPVRSNTPLRGGWGLPAPRGAHVFLDLGEEEYTRGRPHPMIDPEPRAEMILEQARDPTTAAVLLDVVLGFGSHEDPASVLAPACAEAASMPEGPAIVVYVLGTELDPQGLGRQQERFAEAGCLIAPTGARSALMAAAIASRRPELLEEPS
jgi:FdrA protein